MRYGHFSVEKEGNATVVTNTDEKPHDFEYDGETVTLQRGEVRSFLAFADNSIRPNRVSLASKQE